MKRSNTIAFCICCCCSKQNHIGGNGLAVRNTADTDCVKRRLSVMLKILKKCCQKCECHIEDGDSTSQFFNELKYIELGLIRKYLFNWKFGG